MSISLGLRADASQTISVASLIRSLLLFHGTVVIDKDESTLVLRVGVALGTFIAGTEVALGVVSGQKSLRGAFLLASVK